MLGEELPGVLLALAELVALVGEPGAALLDELRVDAHVQEASLLGDPLAVDDVELGLPEGRRELILHDLRADPRPHGLGAVLQVVDLAHVQANGRVELERTAAGRRFGVAEHHTDLLAELVDEHGGRVEP